MTEQNIQLAEKLLESIERLEQLKKQINLQEPLKGRHRFLKRKLKQAMQKTRKLADILRTKTIEADNLKKLSNEVINSRSTLQ